jgi:hypothetical protein
MPQENDQAFEDWWSSLFVNKENQQNPYFSGIKDLCLAAWRESRNFTLQETERQETERLQEIKDNYLSKTQNSQPIP